MARRIKRSQWDSLTTIGGLQARIKYSGNIAGGFQYVGIVINIDNSETAVTWTSDGKTVVGQVHDNDINLGDITQINRWININKNTDGEYWARLFLNQNDANADAQINSVVYSQLLSWDE